MNTFTSPRRATGPAALGNNPLTSMVMTLDEPEGTHIAGIVAIRDRLAVQLQGGGMDRVLLIDPVTGAVVGHIALAR